MYTSIITFSYRLLKREITDSYGRIHFGIDLPPQEKSIIIILVAQNQEYYITYTRLCSNICNYQTFGIDLFAWHLEWIILFIRPWSVLSHSKRRGSVRAS